MWYPLNNEPPTLTLFSSKRLFFSPDWPVTIKFAESRICLFIYAVLSHYN